MEHSLSFYKPLIHVAMFLMAAYVVFIIVAPQEAGYDKRTLRRVLDNPWFALAMLVIVYIEKNITLLIAYILLYMISGFSGQRQQSNSWILLIAFICGFVALKSH